jgi:hypothetical protein
VDALVAGVREGGTTMALEGRPITDPSDVSAVLADRLDDALGELAEHALLVERRDTGAPVPRP